MNASTKVFTSLLTSSIWCVDDTTLRVWIAMLLSADKKGRVEGSIPGFASLCRVSVQALEKSLEILSSPDPHSRTTTNEGRRIEAISGGWHVINFEAYQSLGSRDRSEPKTSKGPAWKSALPEEVLRATEAIMAIWPRPEKGDRQPSKDRDGSCPPVPRTIAPALASRLAELLEEGVPMQACVSIAHRAVKDYQGGYWIKAAQFFFGKAQDAPFYAHYRAYLSAQQARTRRSEQEGVTDGQ